MGTAILYPSYNFPFIGATLPVNSKSDIELVRLVSPMVPVPYLSAYIMQVKGKEVPRPMKGWGQCGLSGRVMEIMKKRGFHDPLPIQVSPLRPSSPAVLLKAEVYDQALLCLSLGVECSCNIFLDQNPLHSDLINTTLQDSDPSTEFCMATPPTPRHDEFDP